MTVERTKLVVVEATIRLVQEVPGNYTASDIADQNNMNGHGEDGCHWCAINVLNSAHGEPTLCSLRYVREATMVDLENWHIADAHPEHLS